MDDYSRNLKIFLLGTKDEAYGKFKEWKLTQENHVGKNVKVSEVTMGWNIAMPSLTSTVKRMRLYVTEQQGALPNIMG